MLATYAGTPVIADRQPDGRWLLDVLAGHDGDVPELVAEDDPLFLETDVCCYCGDPIERDPGELVPDACERCRGGERCREEARVEAALHGTGL